MGQVLDGLWHAVETLKARSSHHIDHVMRCMIITMGTSRQAAPQVRIDKEGGLPAKAGAQDRFAAAQGPSDYTQAAMLSHDEAHASAMTHACGLLQVASAEPLAWMLPGNAQ